MLSVRLKGPRAVRKAHRRRRRGARFGLSFDWRENDTTALRGTDPCADHVADMLSHVRLTNE
eukprot:10638024-Lingulodinium_polyedra.AAC.1